MVASGGAAGQRGAAAAAAVIVTGAMRPATIGRQVKAIEDSADRREITPIQRARVQRARALQQLQMRASDEGYQAGLAAVDAEIAELRRRHG